MCTRSGNNSLPEWWSYQFNLLRSLILYLYKIKLGEELPPHGINERLVWGSGGMGDYALMVYSAWGLQGFLGVGI